MSRSRRLLPLLLLCPAALSFASNPATRAAVSPVRVTASDLHLEYLRPETLTYVVYMHGAAGNGIQRPMLSTVSVRRNQVSGVDAWVIDQSWENEKGIYHSARTVHGVRDAATLAQTTMWDRDTGRYTATVVPETGRGVIEGELPDAARRTMEAGFPSMKGSWWLNWHSDLTLLPLLPYEKGGTLRVHLFDVGMDAPRDVDYTVLGERTLLGSAGARYECWLVQTDGGYAGTGSFQRFWIDKQRRLVVKEEDVFNGTYRSKVLLDVPAMTEFQLPSS